MDDPGQRKIHSVPIPLAGGLAVMTGLLVPLLVDIAIVGTYRHLFFQASEGLFNGGKSLWILGRISRSELQLAGILLGAIGMLMIGLWDDRVELRPAVKFGGQLLVALFVAACDVRITLFVHSAVFSWGITVLWILTLVNAFNFMDNMNGLCAGLGIIAALYFGLFSAFLNQCRVAEIAFLIAGALLGFLPFNYPKATVFLGDAGSHLIGFLMSVLAIWPSFYTQQHQHMSAVVIPLLVLGIPLFDLVCVVLIRWKMGKPFYIGDNNHLSHRLVRAGYTPARAVMIIWLLAIAVGALAFLVR